jgi:YVTN family beta-propeller protein
MAALTRFLVRASGLIAITAAGVLGLYYVARVGLQPDGSYLLPTGQRIRPAGKHIEVNDRPLGMTLSPEGKTLAVVTGSNFSPRRLHLIATDDHTARQSIALGDSFVGVAFDSAGQKLYVSGGANHDVKVFQRETGGQFRASRTYSLPQAAPSGLALSPDGATLYVALNLKHALAIIDVESGAVHEQAAGLYPYTVSVTQDGSKVYVSNWGGRRAKAGDMTSAPYPVVIDKRGIAASGTVSVIDAKSRSLIKEIETGLHPSALALGNRNKRLYVANANSDTVSVIDTSLDAVTGAIPVGPYRKAPLGSSPNALALSGDERTLYVANAANNAVAVVSLSANKSTVRGLIPVGWYPTAVTLGKDEKRLFVASGYGFGSVAPMRGKGRSYRDRAGVVSKIELASESQLSRWTNQVLDNNRAQHPPPRPAAGAHPVPMNAGQASPIRHIFYIIKENRTYDQVFGDLSQANGDPSLVQFGRDVTPNHHALAEQFVLLDNFYAPGDQSALGHRWCTQGYAGDWVHKFSNARNDSNPMVFAPTDFIWDNAKAHGVAVRSYGERGSVSIDPPNSTWTAIYQDWKKGEGKIRIKSSTPIAGLRDVYSPDYPAFSMLVPDQWRAEVFLRDFREFEKNGNLPRLTILLLPADHTNGTAPGYPTPRAMVADNDLALGRIVEAITRSRYWKESAIFVVEDDAQNGVDHVAGHRTLALVIGPWVRRKAVDSTFYTTINLYRTMEQILGLPPTSQFDLAAEPMFSVFTATPDFVGFSALENRIPLDEMNPPLKALRGLERQLAEASLRMDFEEPDAAPEDVLNRAIWHSVKGFSTRYPGR